MTGPVASARRYNTRRSGKADRTSDDSGFENDSRTSIGGGIHASCEEDMMIAPDESVKSQNMENLSAAEEDAGNGNQGHQEQNGGMVYEKEQDESEENSAKIQRLELHLEVILDENNLLQLELQDVQKTADEKVAGLEGQVTELQQRLLDKEGVMEQATLKLEELRQLTTTGFGEHAPGKLLLDKLGELYALMGLSESVEIVEKGKGDEEENKKMDMINPTENGSSSSAADNSTKDCGIDEKSTAPQPTSVPKSRKTTMDENSSSPKLPLRRSKRKSLITTEKKDETECSKVALPEVLKATTKPDHPPAATELVVPTDVPQSAESEIADNIKGTLPPSLDKEEPSVSTQLEPLLESSTTPPPPVLEPVLENVNKTVHARDNSKEDGYHCVCGRQYATKQKLNLHILQLTCEWKFSCKICKIKFFEAYRLRMHMKGAHGQQVKESHGCYYCGKVFLERKALFAHQKEAHKRGPCTKSTRTNITNGDGSNNASKRIVIASGKRKAPTTSQQNLKLKKQKIVSRKKPNNTLNKRKKLVLKVKIKK